MLGKDDSQANSGSTRGLRDNDLPVLFQAADAASLRAQSRLLWETAISLLMLIVAAIAGAFVWKIAGTGRTDWAGVLAAGAFVTAVLLQRDLLDKRPEKRWYEGRAAAESAKTLAWRYAMGGEPFRIDTLDSVDADALFVARLRDMLTDLRGLSLPAPTGGEQITPAMRELRADTLVARKAAYATGRIDDQRDWYARKAQWNEARAGYWGWALLGIEIVGALAAILKAIGMVDIDVLGLAGTVAAAGTSWLQTQQHGTLAEAYSLAAQELAAVKARIIAQETEEDWARFMNEAEEAISREHTLWRASHGRQ